METATPNTIQTEDRLLLFRRIWTINLSSKRWKRIRRELVSLEAMPQSANIAPRSIARLYNKRWLCAGVSLSPITLKLLAKLLGAFVASPHFLRICRRFGVEREDGLKKLGVAVCVPLMAFWTNRQFPRLHRALFRGELKRNFILFRAVPLRNFFNYAPLFVLYRLTTVLTCSISAKWALSLITGKNLRQCPGLPFPLTRMMAHWTVQAPYYLSFEEALFYGRVRGLGGSDQLHDRLRSCFDQFYLFNDHFKAELLPFLARHEKNLDLRELPVLLGYLHHRYFENRQNDAFLLASYSLPRLQREMGEWYTTVESDPNYQPQFQGKFWRRAAHAEFESQVGKKRYHIVELTSYDDLCKEGKRLRHCVATYVEECMEGWCSIWSLRLDAGQEEEKSLVTIEVDTEGNIKQALGKHNSNPKPEHMYIIRKWATQEKLKFKTY